MKKLLLLGGSRYLLPAIRAAHEVPGGVHVITCDYLPDNIAHRYSDEYHNVSIVDKEAVFALAQNLKIDGILSFATDPGVVAAAYVAEKMGLPTPCSYESACILQNKDMFRDFLQKNGFEVPFHRSYVDKADAMNDVGLFEFPVVVKPVDSAGSKGVTKVECQKMMGPAIDAALSSSISGRFLVEQFIDMEGSQSGSDSFAVDGKLVFASFDRQFYDKNSANPFTPSAMCYPSDMPLERQQEIKGEVQRLLNLLHVGTTILNIECRIGKNGKAYLMEVSPRAGGNRVAEILRYATGTDLIKNNVFCALGLPVEELHDPHYKGAYARVVLHSRKKGRFKNLHIIDDVRPYIFERDLWVAPGDEVNSFTGANASIGLLFLRFPTVDEAERRLNNVDAWLNIEVE